MSADNRTDPSHGNQTPNELDIEHVTVDFAGLLAVDDISLSVPKGRITAIVGESGSGKSTLARVIAGLQPATTGTVRLEGRALSLRRRPAERRAIQLVPQDPYASLNPRLTVRHMLTELLHVVTGTSRGLLEAREVALLRMVQLDRDALDAYPQQFSGGQRQRIALARALAVEPSVLVLDEPTSALDASVQREVVRLLHRLRRDLALTMVFISHDLGVVQALCDDIAVIRTGRMVEHCASRDFFAHPSSDYSRELLRAVPRLERRGDAAAT